jgi:hypothetical protein
MLLVRAPHEQAMLPGMDYRGADASETPLKLMIVFLFANLLLATSFMSGNLVYEPNEDRVMLDKTWNEYYYYLLVRELHVACTWPRFSRAERI